MTTPTTPEPLLLSREIANAIADADWGPNARLMVPVIDARIRPLVEALRAVQKWDGPGCSLTFDETMAMVDAALKAAGAE